MKKADKLYYFKTDIVFASDGERPDKDAKLYLKEQTECCVTSVIEILSIEQLKNLNPSPEWLSGVCIWGSEKDISAREFLNINNEEYQLYLKLKEKYE
jgi:hypothetical protein